MQQICKTTRELLRALRRMFKIRMISADMSDAVYHSRVASSPSSYVQVLDGIFEHVKRSAPLPCRCNPSVVNPILKRTIRDMQNAIYHLQVAASRLSHEF